MGREMRKASGSQLITQTQEAWQQCRDQIPGQQRRELGQVLTELSARISYACNGEEPQQRSKYSTLGGAELASHAAKTVQKVSSVLPVDASRDLSTVITEMAHRVRFAAEGEPQWQPSGGETFDGWEQQQQEKSKHADTVFA